MRNIPVAYEDDWILIVEKPSGLLTIPTPKNERNTLTDILNEEAKNKGLSFRMHPCHRLDRDTSGLIIYAKGKSIQKKIMDEFKGQRVKKKYVAFVQGQIKGAYGQISKRIDGSSALTKYQVLERRKSFNIVEVSPLSGRKNQIRIHFKSIGHPIVGEDKFVFRKDFALRFRRLCLHAKSLEFRHPVTQKILSLDTDLPKDMENFLHQNPR